MDTVLMQRTERGDASATLADRDSYCPECGQSLDLSRHSRVPPSRKTWEPWLFLAVGLGLAILFGLQVRQVREEMIGVDQQIAASGSTSTNDAYGTRSNQQMLRNDQKNPLLTYHALLRRDLNRDEIGFSLGLLAIAVGISSAIRRRQGRGGSLGEILAESVLGQIMLGLWGCAEILAGSVLRALVIVFALGVGGQILRGAPPTPALVEQAFRHSADILTTIGGMLT